MESGHISSDKEGFFRWTICNFFGTSFPMQWRNGINMVSPCFTFSGVEYELNLKIIEKILHLSFHRRDFAPIPSLYLEFQVTGGYRRRSVSHSLTMHNTALDYSTRLYCCATHIKDFISTRHVLSFDEHLTISFALRRLSDDDKPPDKLPTVEKLQNDLMDLFLSKEDCDVFLNVPDKEFPAHRAILRARSPVFKAMFSHEMAENRTGAVNIDDCDPKIFPDFLKYLYTGSIEHISDENVCQLYTISDKYQVEELKAESALFMKDHLSVETFCDFFTLGLKYTEEELIHLATEFFCANVTEVAKTAKWVMFLEENSAVGNELFLKAWPSGKKILEPS